MCESSDDLARHRVLWSSAVVSQRGIRGSKFDSSFFSLSYSRSQTNNILHDSIPKIGFFGILTWRLRDSLSKFNFMWLKLCYKEASDTWRNNITNPFLSSNKSLYFHCELVWCAFYKDVSFMAISNPQWKNFMGLIKQMCSQLEAAQDSTWLVSVLHFFNVITW